MSIRTNLLLWRRVRPLLYGGALGLVVTEHYLKAFVLHAPGDFDLIDVGLDFLSFIIMIEVALWGATYLYNKTVRRLVDTRVYADRLQALSRLGQALATESDETRVCQQVVTHLHKALGFDEVRLYTVDDNHHQHLRAFVGHPPLDEQYLMRPGDRGYFQHFPMAHWRYSKDISSQTSTYLWLTSGSEVFLPLRIRRQIAGFLLSARPEVDAYSDADLELLGMVAQLLGNTLLRLKEYREQERFTAELTSLQETMTDIMSKRELPVLLDAILQRAVRLLHADGGDLGLYDDLTGETLIVASIGLQDQVKGERLHPDEGVMGWVAKNHKPLFVQDYMTWHNRSRRYKKLPRHTQVLAVPLMASGKFIGSIGIVHYGVENGLKESDTDLLERFAQQAALAVENVRLYQKAVQAAEKQHALHLASQSIVAALVPEKVYAAVHDAVRQVIPAEAFMIVLLNRKRDYFIPVYVMDQGERFQPPPFPSDEGLSGEVLRTGQAMRIHNVHTLEEKKKVPHFGFASRVQSVLAVPMCLKGEIIGVLSTQSCVPYAYSEDDATLLSILAGYTAVVLENTRLFTSIRNMAIRDELTGMYNRRYLFRRAAYELARAQRYGHPLGVIMIDIDHFKHINDTYGHGVGDQVLQIIAHTCQRMLRKIDILGRYGGEEFTVLLPQTDVETTGFVAERLRAALSAHPVNTDAGPVQVTISVGMTAFLLPDDSLNALFRRADQALYKAKNNGRNRVCRVLLDKPSGDGREI